MEALRKEKVVHALEERAMLSLSPEIGDDDPSWDDASPQT
eukprot:CAMPEP_0182869088 /NCGR_PEP_ID=MMETSP0034_2-20130328/9716_1 /TAXON_ID=156128 /ORGANISM="Nephroselmis pyriformis, Strain CCMP717" /LENGTH=39 /DNA_ID= /DNA_START= /DNA_END= /DNA_ORIENTATION=